MQFWAQEKEKLSLWWQAVSVKEIGAYFFYAFLFLFLVFSYYLALGVTGLFEWYRSLRSMCECGILLFLTQLVTRKSLLHPFWRIGYIPFFSWVGIFPYVILHARNGINPLSFNQLSPYFLTALSIELLIFFIMNVICRVFVGKRLATLICLSAVCFFSFNAFAFGAHYFFMNIMMTPREMFFVLSNTGLWIQNIILTHISLPILILWHLGLLFFACLYAKWIYKSAYALDPRWIPKDRKSYSVIHRLLQFLVFFGCAWLLIRWASECFPLHDYEMVKEYQEYIEYIQNTTF